MDTKTAVEPTSNSVLARDSKTELEPSAPALQPVKLSEDIATIADVEAGASLSDLISPSSSNTEIKPRADSTDSTGTVSSEGEDICFVADAEAGVFLGDIMPKRGG